MEDKTPVLLLLSAGLQPPGSKQGLRTTARALLRDSHPGLQLCGREEGAWPSWEAMHQSQVQEMGGQREPEAGLSLGARSREAWASFLALSSQVRLCSPVLSLHICHRSRLDPTIPKGTLANDLTSGWQNCLPWSCSPSIQCWSADSSRGRGWSGEREDRGKIGSPPSLTSRNAVQVQLGETSRADSSPRPLLQKRKLRPRKV